MGNEFDITTGEWLVEPNDHSDHDLHRDPAAGALQLQLLPVQPDGRKDHATSAVIAAFDLQAWLKDQA